MQLTRPRKNQLTFTSNKLNYKSGDLSWQSFIEECGPKADLDNSLRANLIFEKKFKGKIVTWKGHVIATFVNNGENGKYGEAQHGVRIRMLPSMSLKSDDIHLLLGKKND